MFRNSVSIPTQGSYSLLGINGTKLVEFSENYQGDQGSAFALEIRFPRYAISKDWTGYGYIERAYVRGEMR